MKTTLLVSSLFLLLAGQVVAQEAEPCFSPYGQCPKHIRGVCLTPLNAPECLGSIDCGDGSEEDLVWRAYPKSIEAICRSNNESFKQAEYYRCKFLHERRKRLNKPFNPWGLGNGVGGVNCRQLLK